MRRGAQVKGLAEADLHGHALGALEDDGQIWGSLQETPMMVAPDRREVLVDWDAHWVAESGMRQRDWVSEAGQMQDHSRTGLVWGRRDVCCGASQWERRSSDEQMDMGEGCIVDGVLCLYATF